MSVTNGQRQNFFDLDAARAARAEAIHESFAFRLGGEEFMVMPTDDWPIEAQALLAEGDLVQAIPQLLVGGHDTYQRLIELHATVGDLNDLFKAVGKWAGTGDLPNFAPPPLPASIPT